MISKGFYEYLETIADERRLDKEDVLKDYLKGLLEM